MQAWEKFLKLQEKELGRETADKWLRSLQILDFDACNLYLQAKDAFQVMWFEEHVRKKAELLLVNGNHQQIHIHLTTKGNSNPSKSIAPKKETEKTNVSPFTPTFDPLDPLLTFENIASFEENLLAYTLLSKIAHFDPVSKQYIPASAELSAFNPIYLFGKQGTGKTHFLMATAHALKNNGLNTVYVRAETFTEHVITAIRAGEMSLFRQAYRNIDVLLIDDVQLFSKKHATQEELFHTFNTLHLAGKQILLASRCAPQELQQVEPRLISRFEWGIVLPLGVSSQEEMKKILQTKAAAYQSPLPLKVEEFLITSFSSHTKALVKSLETLLLRHHMHAQKERRAPTPLTVSTAQYHLKDLIEEEKKGALTPEKILISVAEHFGIKKEDIFSKTQKRTTVLPRQTAMYFCRKKLKIPYLKIGELFSRDHSTVMSSIKAIQKGIDSKDKEIAEAYLAIEKRL